MLTAFSYDLFVRLENRHLIEINMEFVFTENKWKADLQWNKTLKL